MDGIIKMVVKRETRKDINLFYFYKIDIEEFIDSCEQLGHIQQVAYSTHHKGLTQTCFSCLEVRTNIKEVFEDVERK